MVLNLKYFDTESYLPDSKLENPNWTSSMELQSKPIPYMYLINTVYSGAHTIGNQDNKNILISFASFRNDGSCVKMLKNGVMEVHAKTEDIDQNEQYKIFQTQVQFYSLNTIDFHGCEDVDEFLEKMRVKISNDNTATSSTGNAVKRTSLFLQDFPSEGT